MDQEVLGSAEGHRPARRAPSPPHADQAELQQGVEGATVGLDAADGFNLRTGHGLVIGDNGEGLLGRPRQLALLLPLLGHQEGEIRRGLEAPATGDADQFDPTLSIARAQGVDRGGNIGPLRQSPTEVLKAQGFGRGE